MVCIWIMLLYSIKLSALQICISLLTQGELTRMNPCLLNDKITVYIFSEIFSKIKKNVLMSVAK